jgi:secreted PhoX family phosphatase
MAITRRQLIQRSGGLGLGIAFAGSVESLFGATAHAASSEEAYGYGPLIPDPNKILDLPEGFTYRTFSKFRDPSPGGPVPTRHDGMCTFPAGDGHTRLVRNHENQNDSVKVPAPPLFTYDPRSTGGTMTLELDDDLNLLSQYGSLGGTVRHCAGGRTPWGTWLSCEETELRQGAPGRGGPYTKDHGWVFEVDPENNDNNASPTPLVGMGRYAHEAVAIDPETNTAYLTEDAASPFGLLYRFTPVDPGGGYGSYRAGGTLEAMYVPDVRDLSIVSRVNTRLNHVEWVPVPDPTAFTVSTRDQLTDEQVTRSQKLEGAWFDRGAVYIVASFAREENGSATRHDGQVWRYEPKNNSLTLELIFNSGGRFNSPDNITISPFGGGVVLAEDGSDGDQYLVGAAQNGRPFPIARNALNTSELAGVTFSDDRRTLFGNIYSGAPAGLSFAIRGPWDTLSPADPGSNAGGHS